MTTDNQNTSVPAEAFALETDLIDPAQESMVAGPGEQVAMRPVSRAAVQQASRYGRRARHVRDIDQTAGNIPQLEMEEAVQRAKVGRFVDPARTDTRNFSLDYIDSADDIKQFMDDTSIHLGTSEGPRMGVQTHAETREKATAGGPSLDDILTRKPSETYNAEQLVRARAMMVTGAEEIYEMAQRMTIYDPHTGRATLRPEVSAEEEYQFRKRLATYSALQHQVQGAVKEAARSLNAMKIAVGNDILAGMNMREKLDAFGGTKMTEGLALSVLQTGGNPRQIAGVAKHGALRRSWNAIQEIWINGLLSAPSTHAINSIGNATTAVIGGLERYTAAFIGLPRHLVTGSQDRVMVGEANALLNGMARGVLDGFLSFGRALVRSEEYTGSRDLLDPGRVKTESLYAPSVTAENLGLNEEGMLGQAVDLIGKYYIRVPGRLLEAEDEFFKAIGYSMELHASAYRRAVQDGHQPGTPEFNAAYGGMLNDPPEALAANAMQFARYQTFTNDLTDPLSKKIQEISNLGPMKLFLPFVRTPTNILKYGMARNVTGLMMPSVLADLKKGGAARDMAVARMSLGSILGGVGMMWAANYEEGPDGQPVHRPLITGAGPTSLSAQGVWRDAGIAPYSIYIDGKYVPYDRYEPFGQQLATWATAYEVLNNTFEHRRQDEQRSAIVLGLADYLLDKSFFQGASELVMLLSGQRNPQSFGTNLAASFIPNWLRRSRQESDEYMRETKGGDFLAEFVNKATDRLPNWVPGVKGSESLPYRVDVWGKPMKYGEPLLFSHVVSPSVMHAAKHNKLTAHLIENGAPEKKPDAVIDHAKKDAAGGRLDYKIDLLQVDKSGRIYAEYLALVGKERERLVRNLVSSQAYKDLPVGAQRRSLISREFDRGAKLAGEEIVKRHYQRIAPQLNRQDAQRTRGYTPTLPPHFNPVTF